MSRLSLHVLLVPCEVPAMRVKVFSEQLSDSEAETGANVE